MASLNKMLLIGNVGNHPEVRKAPSGRSMVNIRLATTETWKDKGSGEEKASTEWHRVVFYAELADLVGETVRAGMEIYVEGRLKTRKYKHRGVDKTSTEIEAYVMVPTGSSGICTATQQAATGNRTTPTPSTTTSPGPVSAGEPEAIH